MSICSGTDVVVAWKTCRHDQALLRRDQLEHTEALSTTSDCVGTQAFAASLHTASLGGQRVGVNTGWLVNQKSLKLADVYKYYRLQPYLFGTPHNFFHNVPNILM